MLQLPFSRLVTLPILLAVPPFSNAQVEIIRDDTAEQVRIYKTPAERREAGRKYELTDWLAVAGLLELEYLYQRADRYTASGHSREDDFSKTLQLAAELTPWSWMQGELIYEYDDEANRHTLDEATATFEEGDLELVLGKQYLPFGVYFSHFVSDPVLQFGETRDRGLTLSYGPDDRLDLAVFAYRGRAGKTGGNDTDGGLALEASPSEFGSFGISYLSDLADSQEGFLREHRDRYEDGVSGWSAYVIAGVGEFEITAELVRALGTFRELEADRNRPRAWNIEFAHYPRNDFEWSLRLEGSNEVEDAPQLRGGVAIAWRVMKHASLTLEYLRAKYRRGMAEDSSNRSLHNARQAGALLTIDF